jgi:hypothetical protein
MPARPAGSSAPLADAPRWQLRPQLRPAGSCAPLAVAPRWQLRPAGSCAPLAVAPRWQLRPAGSCAPLAAALRFDTESSEQARREGLDITAYYKDMDDWYAQLKTDDFLEADGDADKIARLTEDWRLLDQAHVDEKRETLRQEKSKRELGYVVATDAVLPKRLLKKLTADGLVDEIARLRVSGVLDPVDSGDSQAAGARP